MSEGGRFEGNALNAMQALLRNALQIVHLVVKSLAWRGRLVGLLSHRWHHDRVSGMKFVRRAVAVRPAGRHSQCRRENRNETGATRSEEGEVWR